MRFVVLVLVTVSLSLSLGYDRSFAPVGSCDSRTLQEKYVDSAEHLQRMLQIYDHRFFNLSCVPGVPFESNPWDRVRPYPKITIFMHIGLFPTTKEVVDEIMTAVEMSGLLKEASLYVGFSGKGERPRLPAKAVVLGNDSLSTAEHATYTGLLAYLAAQPAGSEERILYLHSKGSHHHGGFDRLLSRLWRRYMLYFNVWLFRWALILLQRHETYGVSLRGHYQEDQFNPFKPHYSGSFWWSKVRYLKRVDPSPLTRRGWMKDRTIGEIWVGSGVEAVPDVRQRMSCLLASGVNHYSQWFFPNVYATWRMYARLAPFVYAHARARPRARDLHPWVPLPGDPEAMRCVVDCRRDVDICGFKAVYHLSGSKHPVGGKKPPRGRTGKAFKYEIG